VVTAVKLDGVHLTWTAATGGDHDDAVAGYLVQWAATGPSTSSGAGASAATDGAAAGGTCCCRWS
jgi:hypothetical protein